MIFLIDNNRKLGRIISLRTFEKSERKAAHDACFAAELEIGAENPEREVVILEAPNKAALRETHGRYFKTLEELAQLPKANGQ